ncbi:mannose-ethanolamine phosphotransferase gpi13 [Dinochytrium kinnereticum]|nr:mannose-ethanolamine phosphotransferase gpi13 [Dinochytrium kinnereticum]
MADAEIRRRTDSAKSLANETKAAKIDSEKKADYQKGKTWGRARDIGFMTIFTSFMIMALCPLLVIYFWRACDTFKCDLIAPVAPLIDLAAQGQLSSQVLSSWFLSFLPTPTPEGFMLYFGWLLFQAALFSFLPGPIGYGQTTPAGHTLEYIVNGLLAWFVTHILYFGASIGLGLFDAALVHDHWGALLIAANAYGYFLTLFSYVKAHLFPSHAADRKFSGSVIYDMFMGIEFNPRLGKLFDFKLFHNGRPGIVAWTLINASFAAAQYREIGYVTNSMLLLNFLHAVYVLDFFKHEDWYLRTIDLAWGDSVWLPWMYTLQSHFLVRHPLDLSWPFFSLVLGVGLLGYYIFRAVNNQKDIVRRTDGKCNIWGRPAKVIRTEFETSDGKIHRSLLLTSGFWGVSRHFNYVGDLLISLAMCMTCGFGYLLPYFYIIYMTILLVHRIARDDARCRGKYGKFWDQYCKAVPYKGHKPAFPNMFQRKMRTQKAVNELKAAKSSTTHSSNTVEATGGATAVILKNLTISNWFIPRLSIVLVFILLTHVVGIYLFASGFLLSRLELDTVNQCGTGALDDALGESGGVAPLLPRVGDGCWTEQRFKRAVLIVIDALRFDFTAFNETIESSGEPIPHYLNKLPVMRNLLRDQPDRSLLVRVRADAPTTTLQRLKALTTGTLPTFVDAGSNFGGAVIGEDNILEQIVGRGGRIVFMGDDTWVGLYPTQMNESYPYPSFNVQDLHTVDNGCIEHLFPALSKKEKHWDLLVAHFLGVDHVGHTFGPYTLPMASKLTQVNTWLEKTFSMLDEDTVALVIGDHGMDPKGDHGGDSENEVNAALFVYSGGRRLVDVDDGKKKASAARQLKEVMGRIEEVSFEGGEPYAYLQGWRTMPQIDFVPTLALLIGLPIPFGNLGTIIPELFLVPSNEGKEDNRDDVSKSVARLLDATRVNARQIFRYLKDYSQQRASADFDITEFGKLFGEAEKTYTFLSGVAARKAGKTARFSEEEIEKAWDTYFKYVVFMRKALVAARRIWARFDVPLIVMGVSVLALSVLCAIVFALLDWLSVKDLLSLRGGFLNEFRVSHVAFLGGLVGGAAVGVFTGTVKWVIGALASSGEDSVLSKQHEVAFGGAMTAMLAYLVASFVEFALACRVWKRDLPIHRPVPAITLAIPGTAANMFIAVLLLVLHMVIPASNSFTIHEESVTAYLLQFFGLFTLSSSLSARNNEARGSLLMHSILFMILTRFSQSSTICREETLQSIMCYPTFHFIPNSSVASPHSVLGLLVLVPVVIGSLRASLRGTENLNSTGAFLIDYCVPIGLSISAVYWALDTFEGHHLFAAAGAVWGGRLAFLKLWLAKLGFLSMSLMCLYVWGSDPVCIGLKKEITPIPGGDGKTGSVRYRLSGVRNAVGAAYMVFVAIVYMVLVMFQKPMGGVMLGVEMMQILCLVEIIAVWREDAVRAEVGEGEGNTEEVARAKITAKIRASLKGVPEAISEVPTTAPVANTTAPVPSGWYDLSLLMLHGSVLSLVGHRAFFATGHQATISSIQWDLAFVGLTSVNWYISPVMVALNTFGGPLLALLSSPLLPLWRRPVVGPTQERTVRELTFTILWQVIGTSAMGMMATAFCGHFRRHLMVWKIFAPKFIFADVLVVIVDIVGVLGVGVGLWLPWIKYREFLDMMEKKGMI